ncbi:MAG TPA: molybdenum cofactor biosynthesis protein MoaE [Thermoplasmata archaeon]|nr:molybdenum cofactor biosynthesis protein MoaE [Thermoplasmata archaeon]
MSVRLSRRPLSLTAAMRALEGPGLGGVALFAGRVRPDATRKGRVVALDYEAHRPMALAALAKLERDARRKFGVGRVVVWHRLGRVPVDEVSVIVGVAAGHRTPAFGAARYLIETLKREVPIWKLEQARPARRRRSRPAGRATRSAG